MSCVVLFLMIFLIPNSKIRLCDQGRTKTIWNDLILDQESDQKTLRQGMSCVLFFWSTIEHLERSNILYDRTYIELWSNDRTVFLSIYFRSQDKDKKKRLKQRNKRVCLCVLMCIYFARSFFFSDPSSIITWALS